MLISGTHECWVPIKGKCKDQHPPELLKSCTRGDAYENVRIIPSTYRRKATQLINGQLFPFLPISTYILKEVLY